MDVWEVKDTLGVSAMILGSAQLPLQRKNESDRESFILLDHYSRWSYGERKILSEKKNVSCLLVK